MIKAALFWGAPELVSDSPRETVRAGRQGEPAGSIVLLRAAWEPQPGGRLSKDREPMRLLLTKKHLSSGVLGDSLDKEK